MTLFNTIMTTIDQSLFEMKFWQMARLSVTTSRNGRRSLEAEHVKIMQTAPVQFLTLALFLFY
jgi:hypothetical protein